MTRVNITENIWYDPEVKNYVMLDVTDAVGAQEARVIDGVDLLPKHEYHVTLVPAGKLGKTALEVAAIINNIESFLKQHPAVMQFQKLGTERYICRKDDEMTLIAPAVITGLDALRAIVRQRVPDYQPAFPHVTLLKSANSPYGIGINSQKDLANYCIKV
ncbi:MAG: hypothetical protein WAQ25_03950 [Candidatus Saccharimonas sp.]